MNAEHSRALVLALRKLHEVTGSAGVALVRVEHAHPDEPPPPALRDELIAVLGDKLNEAIVDVVTCRRAYLAPPPDAPAEATVPPAPDSPGRVDGWIATHRAPIVFRRNPAPAELRIAEGWRRWCNLGSMPSERYERIGWLLAEVTNERSGLRPVASEAAAIALDAVLGGGSVCPADRVEHATRRVSEMGPSAYREDGRAHYHADTCDLHRFHAGDLCTWHDGSCVSCGVCDEVCDECGGRGYHRSGCPHHPEAP